MSHHIRKPVSTVANLLLMSATSVQGISQARPIHCCAIILSDTNTITKLKVILK